jgi:outer membrane protein, heavy metal efflux system
MNHSRGCARAPGIAVLLLGLVGSTSAAVTETPLPEQLTLPESIRIALDEQPALAVESATVRALRHDAIAERQLPDPQLLGGVTQLPVNGDAAFNLRGDDFTALSIGVMQEFPRASKRELLAAGLEQQAVAREHALNAVERQIRRSVAWDYLEVLGAGLAAQLTDALAAEAQRQREIAGIELANGRMSQQEVLAAAIEVEALADRSRAWRQREQVARASLGRWIGAAADRPLPPVPPSLAEPPPLEVLLTGLDGHPLLAQSDATSRVAVTDLKLAEAGSRPDWRVELRYDRRAEFADLVTLMVGVDLPLFTAERQDRSAAAAGQRLVAARARSDQSRRELSASLMASWRNWESGRERLRRYDDALLPAGRKRVDAALAAYRSAQGTLTAILAARRELLEFELMRLGLSLEVLRERIALQYFETAVQS